MEGIKINIDCSDKDFRSYYFSTVTTGIIKKIYLAFIMIFATSLIAGLVMILSIDDFIPQNKIFITLMLLFFLIFVFFTLLLNFKAKKNAYFKNPLYKSLWYIDENGIDISNDSIRHTISWGKLFRIKGYKTCFVIYESIFVFYIIPRGYFGSQEQLDLFIQLIRSKVERKKIKLKSFKQNNNIRFTESTLVNSCDRIIEEKIDVCILKLAYRLTLKESLKFLYKIAYSSAATILLTVFGIMLLYAYFNMSKNILFGLNIVYLLLLGIIFTFFIPVISFINAIKGSRQENLSQLSFYNDYIIHATKSYSIRINRADLTKFKETKTAFYLRSKTYALMIPKRVFENIPDSLNQFKALVKQYMFG